MKRSALHILFLAASILPLTADDPKGTMAQRTENGWLYRIRIPRRALDILDLAKAPHLNLAVKVNNNGPGKRLQTSDRKTTAKRDHFSFVPYWTQKWSIETPWGVECCS